MDEIAYAKGGNRTGRTAEKYEGIKFTDIQGNILQDQINDDDNNQDDSQGSTGDRSKDNLNNIYYKNNEEHTTNITEKETDKSVHNKGNSMAEDQSDTDHTIINRS